MKILKDENKITLPKLLYTVITSFTERYRDPFLLLQDPTYTGDLRGSVGRRGCGPDVDVVPQESGLPFGISSPVCGDLPSS